MIKLTRAAKTKQFPDKMSERLYNQYGGLNNDLFYEKLKKLKQAVKNVAICMLKNECLEKQGLPSDCNIVFSNTTQLYVDKSGNKKIYKNTTAYITQNSQKYNVSKKYPYPARLTSHMDYNDPQNPICRLFLQARLELKRENEYLIECETKIAKLYCDSINSMPLSKKVKKFDLQVEIKNAYAELIASDDRLLILKQLQEFLGIDYCIITDSYDVLQKNTYQNKIIDENGRQFRSKNEMIAAGCMADAGVSCIFEPFYPGTNWRADFALICSRNIDVLPTEINCTAGSLRGISEVKDSYELKQIFVEITGKRGEEKYDKKLIEKRRLSKEKGIPLVFVDMTDYPDEGGQVQTHLEYKKLMEIFQNLYVGYIVAAGQFVTPY